MFKFALSKERDVPRGILLDKKWIANKKLSDTKQFENTIKGILSVKGNKGKERISRKRISTKERE